MSGQDVDCPVFITTDCNDWEAKMYQVCHGKAWLLSSVVINLDGVQ